MIATIKKVLILFLPLLIFYNCNKPKPLFSTEHTAAVVSVAFSPDTSLIASADRDRTARVFNRKTGNIVKFIQKEININTIIFSPDGTILAVGDALGTIELWDTDSWEQIKILENEFIEITTALFSQNGKILAAGDIFGVITLWDTQTWKRMKSLKAHNKSISIMAFFNDENRIAVGSYDQPITVWDIEKDKKVHILKGHTGIVTSIGVSPDNKFLYSASLDTQIKKWDLTTGTNIETYTNQEPVRALAVLAEGKMIITGDCESIKFWNTESGKNLKTISGIEGCIEFIAISSMGEFFAAGVHDYKFSGRTMLWEMAKLFK